ncbi:MAG: phosphoribosyltransferase family protein [Wenzhouxiangellaceae bacterium]|nr:phosphoribosyltransferase family protein [Wenzhouxiangellaceae bacterium]
MPENSSLLIEAAQVSAAYDGLAARLAGELPPGEVLMLPVMNGGMFPALEIARRLKRPQRFDYVHATRYRGATRGDVLSWLHWPELPEGSMTVLLIDDIFDEGYTLQAIRNRLPERFEVLTVVLARKQHARGLARDWVDFVGLDLPDEYVFGCGMDYEENFRELDAIWTLNAPH